MKRRQQKRLEKRVGPRHQFWPDRNQYNRGIHIDTVSGNRGRKGRRGRNVPEGQDAAG